MGSWLPEPLPASRDAWAEHSDPAERAALHESATMGVLLLLDRLGPAERAVFVLREAFGLPYAEIAAIVEQSEESCRQLLHRARRRAAAARGDSHLQLDRATARPLIDAFLAAARGGDMDRLRALLRDDVVVTADGNGSARAGRYPIHGAQKADRLFVRVFERFHIRTETGRAWYNHGPAVLIRTPAQTLVYLIDFDKDGLITAVYAVLNPEKVTHLDNTRGAALRGRW